MNTCTINKISPYGMQSAVMINQCSMMTYGVTTVMIKNSTQTIGKEN